MVALPFFHFNAGLAVQVEEPISSRECRASQSDLSGNFIGQFGLATEHLQGYERGTSRQVQLLIPQAAPLPAFFDCMWLPMAHPPPFSSMNSTPAASRVRRTAESFGAVMEVSRAASSVRRMVATPRLICARDHRHGNE